MKIKTLRDIPELKGKKVLLRVDFNVPLSKDAQVEDDSRIKAALPTINFLIGREAKVIILSHLGRPDGKVVPELRLDRVAMHLGKLLKKNVSKSDECIGSAAENSINQMQNGDILVLENTRFHKEEEQAEPVFTKSLAALGDIFVSDAFGTAHRKHASTAALADHLPAYAGFLMEKEIEALSPIVHGQYERPLTMIFGGAKIDSKIGMIEHFITKADYFLIGGGLANTFLAASDKQVGESLYEKDKLKIARDIMNQCQEQMLTLPSDALIADEISQDAEVFTVNVDNVPQNMRILDIGPKSIKQFTEIIRKSKTIIWNGPLGLFEIDSFSEGSRAIAKAIIETNCSSIVGGGDTLDCIKKTGVDESKFTHISTGGGAAIEFLSGIDLPGIKVLMA